MDAGNQSAAVRFLHQTAANLRHRDKRSGFTPSLPELLFGNIRPQVEAPPYWIKGKERRACLGNGCPFL